LVNVTASPLTLGAVNCVLGRATIGQVQTGPTKVNGVFRGVDGNPTDRMFAAFNTLATNWTSPFTVGLRHGGVTAGGTFRWTWALYKVAGQ
jgi:hypothetical protein